MSIYSKPTSAVRCLPTDSPLVLSSVSDAFWRLVSPMTSELGSGLFGSGHEGSGYVAGFGVVTGVDIVPALAAPFATTRPSAPSMTPAPRDVRADHRVDADTAVQAAKQGRPPRGIPR